MKKLQNLVGSKALSKKEQLSVKGGKLYQCNSDSDCPLDMVCMRRICYIAM